MEATTSQVSLASLQTALAGRYSFERELGRGGMATVFLARDLTHDRHVAVKVLLPELAVTLGVERFFREIEVGTMLQHPRIVGVIDSGQQDGILYYTMPYIEGQTLRDRLNREKQLPVEDVISIAQQVADALAYAHTKGVIHRDIKPENILLDKTGALVADFGIARAVSVAGGENLTRTGMAVGTPTYMSPEQAMGSRDVTPESDIYSLACVVYELLAGQPPFTGPTAMALLARHSLDNVPSLKIVRGTVPDAVEDAIVRAMAKVPADRFRTATDFANALTDHAGAARRRQDSLKAKAIAAETVEGPALGAKPKRKGLMVGIAAAVLALGGAGGFFAWQRNKGTNTAADLEAKKHIAVMYFEDRSPGKQLGHVADGITEALITELSAVKELKVISRNGVAAFKGQPATPAIAEQLGGVGTFVTGSISPAAGGKIRVALQLVDAKTSEQLEETRVEQMPDKLLEVQDSLAHNMSLFLREHVGNEIRELASRSGTRNAAAWDAMQRARLTIGEIDALIRQRQVPAAFQKITEADQALAKVEEADKDWRDPVDERAWLAYKAARLIPPSDPNLLKTIDDGIAHAERALKMSASDTSAIEARGTLIYWKWLNNLAKNEAEAKALFDAAEKDLTTATGDVRRASAFNTLSHLLLNKGELANGKMAAERAFSADPYLTDVDRTVHRLVQTSLDLEDVTEAKKWCDVGRSRFPENYRFSECQLWLYAMPSPTAPNIADAWAKYDEVVKNTPETLKRFISLKGKMIVALALVRANQLDSAKALAAASQGDKVLDPRGELTNLAVIVYAQSGDKDTAQNLYAKYLAANPAQPAFAARDDAWWLRDLRTDPRWKKLVGAAN